MKKIYFNQIKEKSSMGIVVCNSWLSKLPQMLGDGAEITEEYVLKNYDVYPWVWCGYNLLEGSARDTFIQVCDTYTKEYEESVSVPIEKTEKNKLQTEYLKKQAILFYKLYNDIYDSENIF